MIFLENKSCAVSLYVKYPGGGVLPIIAYTGRLRPKGVRFSDFKYKKG